MLDPLVACTGDIETPIKAILVSLQCCTRQSLLQALSLKLDYILGLERDIYVIISPFAVIVTVVS